MTAAWTTVPTPDGPFTLIVDGDVVLAAGWSDDPESVRARVARAHRPGTITAGATGPAVDAVEAYYAGELDAPLAVPVRQSGGPFVTLAWGALRTVAAGHPIDYSELASRAGRPGAVRAAASACATNAPALFVPCHRVLRRDGALGGFAWGEALKRRLLDREAASAAQPSIS